MFLWSFVSTLACTVLAYLYQAWASYRAIDSGTVNQHTQWLVYWIVIALFTIFEMLLEGLVSWLPFYYEAKVAFLCWLALPQFRGATRLYHRFVSPTLSKYENEIDRHINDVRRRASSKFGEVASNGLDFVKSKGIEALSMAQDVANNAHNANADKIGATSVDGDVGSGDSL